MDLGRCAYAHDVRQNYKTRREAHLSNWVDRLTFFLGRWYDLEAQLILKDLVKAGDTVVDVGANRGMYTFVASYYVGPNGGVISFEPNPNCIRIMESEAIANQITNVTIQNCGLGDENAMLTLSIPEISNAEATFGKSVYADARKLEVPVKIGDDELRNVSPSLIKIDVEGFEYQVITGLRATIKRAKPIIVTEIIDEHLVAAGSSAAELITLMKSLDYQGFAIHLTKHGSQYDWIAKDIGDEPFNDAIWLPTDSVERIAASLRSHFPHTSQP